MADHTVKAELFDQFARIGQALSSGRRIEILDVLANGERSVEGVAEQVGLSLANASRHLQLLREAGLVSSRRQGTFVRYRLAAPEVYEFWTALDRPQRCARWPTRVWPRSNGWSRLTSALSTASSR
jgi:DNA-binding transcriptional ArsR family regulator